MKERVLTFDEYKTQWEPIHRRIFSGAPVQDGPFADFQWKMVLLPGDLLLDREDFDSLRRMATQLGEREFLVVDGEGTFADELPVAIPWSFECLERFVPSTVFGHAVAHCFGLSGEWGRASSPETFNVLGGSPTFMERFVEISGGMSVLHERFMESVRDGDVSFGRQGEALVQQLLQLVGWDRMP